MHKRSGSFVNGHYRSGSWVESHYRSGTVVDTGFSGFTPPLSLPKKQKKEYNWLYVKGISFLTSCWWCGGDVYFHRSKNNGCVLFDELGTPWPVHSCWTENKEQQEEAMLHTIEKYKKRLRETRIENHHFGKNPANLYNFQSGVEAFLVGCDLSKRVILNKLTPNQDKIYFRYLVYRISRFGLVKVLAQEKHLEQIISKPVIFIGLSTYNKNQLEFSFIMFAKKSEQGKHIFTLHLNPEDYLKYNWIHQKDLLV